MNDLEKDIAVCRKAIKHLAKQKKALNFINKLELLMYIKGYADCKYTMIKDLKK